MIVATALVSGCGGRQAADTIEKAKAAPAAPREVWLTLDGSLGAANVPIQVAIEMGYFSDAGLTVVANSPLFPNRPVNYVTSSTDDLGVTQQPQVAIAKENNAPIIAVGSLVSQPTAAMIWLRKSKIRGISDLKGKTIAVPGIPYQEDLLESVLAKAGLSIEDIEIEHAPYELVPTLLKGEADAIFGGSWNIEGIALRERGAKPVVRRVQELGVPSYDELMVIARADRAAEEPRMIRDFMGAVTRATAMVVKDPEAAVKAIEESNSLLNHKEIEAQVRATVPLLSTTGRIDPAQADDLMAWMQEQGMIRRKPSFSELFTNEYLPAEE